ncbi:Tim44/TimA family putative adaptor protein [Temperatibacter marinus]|uniref:Tim44/TimA family putative adaptor protein n=1 Tax=Temperatibacter marinus TaxID=1456591 RepID=A0AA52EJJ8_9PROT|nr:Tim44/TimA family putative adaptor protein [Temperatibacter marinus]WND03702.1 Tim44/TimA family putative adaptor protein [Temperatibacter marinus]
MGIDILILALIAAFILLRLRSELGREDEMDDDPSQHNTGFKSRFDPSRSKGAQDNRPQKLVDQRQAPVGDQDHILHDVNQNMSKQTSPQDYSGAILQGLKAIAAKDRNFNPDQFTAGARSAYPMILEAFWKGDKETLETFLSPEVYSQFAGAVDAREASNLTIGNQFIDIDSAVIIEAVLQNKQAEITLKFKAEIIAVTKDSEGRIVEGDPSDEIEVNDIWTFSRDVKSKDPNWQLVATRTE